MPLGTQRVVATQRCQVPSGWTGPSHLLRTGPPYRHPALADGAETMSPAAISRAATPPTMPRFMVVSRHIAPERHMPSPTQPATNDATDYVAGFTAFDAVVQATVAAVNPWITARHAAIASHAWATVPLDR